jgi:2,5-diketo-D-gluconate reductase A
MEHVTLNNGVAMPILGFGVFQIPDAAQCEQVVTDALAVSYQSIDCVRLPQRGRG